METITIVVDGDELEQINIELSREEVAAIYRQRKEYSQKITTLEKEMNSLRDSKRYAESARDEAKDELSHAHTLLTALGVADKTENEESYYRKVLPVATRIALYIAKKSG